jgi:acetyl esterase/lipase
MSDDRRPDGPGPAPQGPADPRSVLTRPAPPPAATVSYGPGPDQVADLRPPVPVGTAPRPLVVVIHGGFWRAEYDRRHTGPLAAGLAGLGYPVAQLEYRRAGQPGGGWPGTLDDVLAGVDALPELVARALPEVPVAPGPPVLLGHSAGGQLALWYASRRPTAVRAVVALAPVADLTEAYRLDLDEGAVRNFLGGGPDEVPERYASADPIRSAGTQVRTVVVHGLLDQQVPPDLSRRFVSAAETAGRDVALIELDECEHFGLIDPTSTVWRYVTHALRFAAGLIHGH